MQEIQTSETSHSIDSTPPGNASTMSFFECIELLIKHKRIIIRTTFAALIFSIILSLCMSKSYKSTALFLPPQQENSMMGLMLGQMGGGMASLAGEFMGKGSVTDLYVGIINSDAICDEIIDRFKLMDEYETKYRVDTYKALRKKTEITSSKKSGIITVSVVAKEPKMAADMANAYVEALSKLAVGLNISGAGNDRVYLEGRIEKTKKDLIIAENNLKSFQSKNKALDISEQAKGTIKGVADLEGQLAVEEVKLAGIRRVFTDTSQEVQNQRTVVANLRGQISKFEGMRSGNAVPGVGSVPELGQQYIRLMREFKIQEALLEVLTKQYEMSKLVESKNVSSVQIIQPARIPDKKHRPIRSLIVLATTFMAFAGSVAFSFLLEYKARIPEEERQQWVKVITLVKGK